jgi:hypothetical protein
LLNLTIVFVVAISLYNLVIPLFDTIRIESVENVTNLYARSIASLMNERIAMMNSSIPPSFLIANQEENLADYLEYWMSDEDNDISNIMVHDMPLQNILFTSADWPNIELSLLSNYIDNSKPFSISSPKFDTVSNTPYIYLSVKLKNTPVDNHYITIPINLIKFSRRLKNMKITQESEAFIIDNNGDLIAFESNDEEIVGIYNLYDAVNNGFYTKDRDLIIRELTSGKNGSFSIYDYDLDLDVYVSYTTIPGYNDWTFVIASPEGPIIQCHHTRKLMKSASYLVHIIN